MLSQNYPNPFNPTTNFQFTIADLRFVSFKVFDLLGREAATLVDEKLTAGSYTVQWNAEGFASGLYLARMHALTTNSRQACNPSPGSGQSYSVTKKIVLTK